MSIYIRDDVFPEWEPVPWTLRGSEADEQERGFHQRATKTIIWRGVSLHEFPAAGIFGESRDWFSRNEINFIATLDGEDLVLIQEAWFGFPDPPEWGLATRPTGQHDKSWQAWGHFSRLPARWIVPGETDEPPN